MIKEEVAAVEPRVKDLSALADGLDLTQNFDQQQFLDRIVTSASGFGVPVEQSRRSVVSKHANATVYKLEVKPDAQSPAIVTYVKIVDIFSNPQVSPEVAEAQSELVLKFTREMSDSKVVQYMADVGATFKQENAYGMITSAYLGGDAAERFGAGKNTSELTPKKRFNWRQIQQFAARGMEVLLYMHTHGYLYRDLSPGNIFLDEHDNVHFADWEEVGRIQEDDSVPAENNVTGTWYFRAPEMVTNEGPETKIQPETDIFMFAGLFYFFMTGGMLHFDQPEITKDHGIQKVANFSRVSPKISFLQLQNNYFPLETFFEVPLHKSKLSPEAQESLRQKLQNMDQVLQKALATDQEQRYQTVMELIPELGVPVKSITAEEYEALWPSNEKKQLVERIIGFLKGQHA